MPDDVAFDAHGALTFVKGEIVSRHGISWRIELVEQEPALDNLVQIPTFWVHLSRVAVN
jgi:hypothetical protein